MTTIYDSDWSEYHARLLTYTVTPAAMINTAITGDNSAFPRLLDTQYGLLTLTVTLHVRGNGLEQTSERVSRLVQTLHTDVDLYMPDKFGYRGYCTGLTTGRVFDDLHEVKAIFSAARHGPLITLPLHEGDNDVPCIGTMDAECWLIILPAEGETSCTVAGITVQNLTPGKEVVIDGMKKNITEDGVNKFLDTDLIAFPRISPGRNAMAVTGKSVVKLSYYPAYL